MDIEAFVKSLESLELSGADGRKLAFAPGERPPANVWDGIAQKLHTPLPPAFKRFHELAGDADFFGTVMVSPGDLYRFGEDHWEMEGFIAFAQDAQGDFFAFKPLRGGDDEHPIYKCTLDPLGYAKVCDLFDQWLELHLEFLRGASDKSVRRDHPYFLAELDLLESNERYRADTEPHWWERWLGSGLGRFWVDKVKGGHGK